MCTSAVVESATSDSALVERYSKADVTDAETVLEACVADVVEDGYRLGVVPVSGGRFPRRLPRLLRLRRGIQSPSSSCAWVVLWLQCLLLVRRRVVVHSLGVCSQDYSYAVVVMLLKAFSVH